MSDESVAEKLAKRFNLSKATLAYLRSNPKLVINGELVAGADGATIPVIDPGTEQKISEVAEGKAEDIDRAVKAAHAAFESGPWPSMAPAQRERTLIKLAELIEANATELAEMEALDVGKPIGNTKREMVFAANCYRYYAGWPTKLYGRVNPTAGEMFGYTVREPIGVCALITPWNVPFLLAAFKLAPALAAGNTVVLKPAELTPLSSLRLGQLCLEAGIPPGVVNVVPGYGNTAGQALIEHPGVAKISFTGSVPVGKQIMATAAKTLKRVTLELGGKTPNAVFADANIEFAAGMAVRGVYHNSGQVCTAASRLFVERKVMEPFVESVTKRAQALKVGHGLEPDTEFGPLVSEQQRKRVLGYVEAGRWDPLESTCRHASLSIL